jgi:hypothetical protein
MRTKFILLKLTMLLLVLSNSRVFAQTTLLTQSFATSSWPTGWSVSGTNPPTLNNSNASSGYTGASGGYNVSFLDASTGNKILTYNNNFSTVGYTNITVIWGGRRTGPATPAMDLYWSTDGSTWNGPVSQTQVGTGAVWALTNAGTSITLPVGAEGISNLRLKFQANMTTSASTSSYRLDDITVTGLVACTTPTTAASTIVFSGVGCAGMTVGWTNGNGSNRIVVAKAGSAVTSTPSNSNTYSASTAFGSGDAIVAGEYVVYNGSSNSVVLTGLSGGTTYYFKVFEYNCSPGFENYLTTSPPTNNRATSSSSTNTWNGSSSTAWGTASNWSLNAIPGACDNIIIPNVTNNPIVTGAISVNSITIQNGATLQANAAITINGTFTIDNGGTYIHNNTTSPKTTIFNGTESFAPNSTFEIRNWPGVSTFPHNGSTTASDNTLNGTYGNLTINWSLPAEWRWRGYMTSPSSMVSGTLTIASTGATYDINLVDEGTDHYLTNIVINSANSRLTFKGRDNGSSFGNSTLTLSGDFNMSNGKFIIEEDGELPASATAIQNFVKVNGNFTISGGTFDLNAGQSRGNQGFNELHIGGDITMNGGTIYQTNLGVGGYRYAQRVKFVGSSTQYYSENGTQTIVDYYTYVNAGSTVVLNSNIKICSLSSAFPMMFIFGILDANNKQIYPTTDYSYSGVYILSGGRIQTSNTNGYYIANSSSTTLKDNLSTKHIAAIDPLGVVEYNGTSAQAITSGTAKNTDGTAVSPTRSYGILDINNTTVGGSALTLAASVTTDQLRLNDGIVNVGTNNLIVLNTTAGAAGAIQNHSGASYVNTENGGKLRRYLANSGYPLSYDFPVGNSNPGSHQLMNINITSGNTATYMDVNFDNPSNANGTGLPLTESGYTYNGLIKNGGNAEDATYAGVWTATPNSGTAAYTMSLFGLNASTCGIERHTVVKRSNSAAAWALYGTYSSGSGGPAGVTAARTGLSGFSQFALARSGSIMTFAPLPIDLLGFSGRCEKSTAILNWATASETNNDFFTIEKSTDGKSFYSIYTIKGAGNSITEKKYSYTEPILTATPNYYRLSQTDYDGKKKAFNIISIKCDEEKQGFTFKLNKNPVDNDNISISIVGAKEKSMSVLMIDEFGKEVYSQQIKENNNSFNYNIKPNSIMPSGIYTIIVFSDDIYVRRKVVIN